MKLHVDAFGRLVLTLPSGDRVVGVTPVRCFPFGAPEEHVSLVDGSGKEVHAVPALKDLAPDVRKALEDALGTREFIPVVHRIVSISPGSEPTAWHVETDRGETHFILPSEDNVRRLYTHGALIQDSVGVRYRIPDTRKLDAVGRRIMEEYL